MNNSSVAEDHHRQRKQIADKEREKSDAFLHGIAVVGSKPYARALDYICGQSGEHGLKTWYNEPDERDCPIHEVLLTVPLHKGPVPQFHYC